MVTSFFSLRSYAASLLCAFVLLFAAASCGNDKGKVEGANMLYGTSGKVWKTAKETDAAGDKVKQTDAQEQETLHMFSNNTYSMTGTAGAVQGKFAFDQSAKTLTLTPDAGGTSNTFTVETLTDKKLTLVGTSGAKLALEAE
ncbi:hypothetical protein FNT36_08670 [Hymenobacter setariae]|uniref:Lipocalin-like domain-containing protein n=1 Tax=Hymenobacter setariae TaxID=2594794 RepID=A0A558BYD8_9BACT|nr:hypothetical protein [Hymenobacter setariae]TVT41502.1 hypothetical protein FNT36_08670 [Hymenobacter setariae]